MNLEEQLFTLWEARKTQNPFVPTPEIVVKKKYVFFLAHFLQCHANLHNFPSTPKAILQQFFLPSLGLFRSNCTWAAAQSTPCKSDVAQGRHTLKEEGKDRLVAVSLLQILF